MREEMHRQMLSSVSHDLKTPLATMIGSLEIYQRMFQKLTPEKRASLVQSALSEAYRLDQFITNILDMAKLEVGAIKPRAEYFEINAMLQDCITRLGPRALQRIIRIHGTPPKPMAITDASLLGRAVGLVLDNSLKHAGPTAEVDIEYRCTENKITIQIRDNGNGIPPGKEEDIFSKYTRLQRNDQQNAGTGLGLPICRQIMGLLSGTVTVKNLPNSGASFTLACPYL